MGFGPFSLSHRFKHLKIRKKSLPDCECEMAGNWSHLNGRIGIFMLLAAPLPGLGHFHLILWSVFGELTVHNLVWQLQILPKSRIFPINESKLKR